MYEIITKERDASGCETGQWTADGIGEPNLFATREEAEEAIEALRALGEEWADSTYDIAESGLKKNTEKFTLKG